MNGEKTSNIFYIIDKGVKKEVKYYFECEKLFVNRKKWKNNFNNIRFCSEKCKKANKDKINNYTN